MKTLFHATTKENYERIKKEGFKPQNQIWSCSNDEMVYFYDLEKLEDECEGKDGVILRAIESGQITAAIQGSKHPEIYIFEIQIKDIYVEDDYSCENMVDLASEVDYEDLNNFGKVVNVYESKAFNPHLRFFYIANLVETNEYINSFNLSSIEMDACHIIAKSELHIYELFENEFESLGLEINLK